jgi:hypothetical protein
MTRLLQVGLLLMLQQRTRLTT